MLLEPQSGTLVTSSREGLSNAFLCPTLIISTLKPAHFDFCTARLPGLMQDLTD